LNAETPPIPGVGSAASSRQALAFVTFGVVYYLLAAYAVSLPMQSRLPLMIWPAHGLALGMLLISPVRPTWGWSSPRLSPSAWTSTRPGTASRPPWR